MPRLYNILVMIALSNTKFTTVSKGNGDFGRIENKQYNHNCLLNSEYFQAHGI